MIKPTVGRVVLYHPAPGTTIPCGLVPEEGLTLAALVAVVHDEETITVGAFDRNGDGFGARRVPLIQDGWPVPVSVETNLQMPYCEWMPYQKGQAAKTEALEQVISLGQQGSSFELMAAAGKVQIQAQPVKEAIKETLDIAASGVQTEPAIPAEGLAPVEPSDTSVAASTQ